MNCAGRSAWYLVALGFVSLGVAFSVRSFLGLVMPELEKEFNWSASFISGGGALALISMAIVAPFVGHSIDRRGARQVLSLGLIIVGAGCLLLSVMRNQVTFYAAFGGVSALGFGIVSMNAVTTAIAPFFDTRRGLAIGIASSGATGGQLLIVPLFSLAMSFWGWRVSYVIAAMVATTVALLFWSMMRNVAHTHNAQADQKHKTHALKDHLVLLLRKPAFYALLGSFTICGFTTAGVIETHMMPYASVCGYNSITSASAYGVLSLFNLFGMITSGYLSDRINKIGLLASIYLLRATAFVVLLYIKVDITLLFAFAVAFGMFDYSTVPVTANLASEHLGMGSLGLAMGILATGHALGASVGAYFGGVFFDSYASYEYLWMVSAVASIAASVITLAMPARTRDALLLKA